MCIYTLVWYVSGMLKIRIQSKFIKGFFLLQLLLFKDALHA